mmetsp:Transcript_23756/g.40435  ORF Transcript_23756/g.40435 Transcript_23756/m.40435 type:complete len:113 (+) Transcript_23756:341-679(+)
MTQMPIKNPTSIGLTTSSVNMDVANTFTLREGHIHAPIVTVHAAKNVPNTNSQSVPLKDVMSGTAKVEVLWRHLRSMGIGATINPAMVKTSRNAITATGSVHTAEYLAVTKR